MRILLLLIGLLLIVMGLLWFGQGLGYIHYPAQSFMINKTQWAYYGIGAAILGLLVVIVSSRRF